MPIGQTGERDNLRDSTRIERGSLMRTRSTDTIMASGLVPRATDPMRASGGEFIASAGEQSLEEPCHDTEV
jgi:hypothetical protein